MVQVADQTADARAEEPSAGAPQLCAWALFDWANTPFFTVIVTFVFATYFTQAVAPNEVVGTAYWGWMITASALFVGIASPIIGAYTDLDGRRKRWIVALTLVQALAMSGLWFVGPHPSAMILALGLMFVANSAAEITQAFYNAMLPALVPPARLGRWSGWAWGLGYAAGLAALALVLFGFVQAEPPPFGLDRAQGEDVRISGPLLAAWLVLFALPMFVLVPERGARRVAARSGWRASLLDLVTTLRGLRHRPDILRFLIARLLYNDGLNTLFAFGGIYAAGTFAMPLHEVILFGISLNLTAGIGAVGFGWLDDRLGAKPTILIALCGLTLAGTVALLTDSRLVFWAAGLVIGIFIGPTQSASRSLMARLAPADQRNEMFGLYAATGKLTAFLGPFSFGTLTWMFGTQRAGMASVLAFVIVGALVLGTVRRPAVPAGG